VFDVFGRATLTSLYSAELVDERDHVAKLDEGDQARLDSEVVTVNAVRELINLATHGDSSKATYSQALKLGALICNCYLSSPMSSLPATSC
jgi:hypothetical protein